MNLIKFVHKEDWGHDWYVQVLSTKKWTLFQASVSWCNYAAWPYIQIKSGQGSVFSLLFWTYKFGFDVDIISRTWNWDRLND